MKTEIKHLSQLKKDAKKLSKREKIILTKAQDKIAQEQGFQDWQKLSQRYTGPVGLLKTNGDFEILKYDSKVGSIAGAANAILNLISKNRLEAMTEEDMNRYFSKLKGQNIVALIDKEGWHDRKKNALLNTLYGSITFADSHRWLLSEEQVEILQDQFEDIRDLADEVERQPEFFSALTKAVEKYGARRAVCYWVDPDQHSTWNKQFKDFVPSRIVRDHGGHYPCDFDPKDNTKLPWFWGSTFEEAKNKARKKNESMGCSEESFEQILTSSYLAGLVKVRYE